MAQEGIAFVVSVMEEKLTVTLNKEEQELFVLFRKYQPQIKKLMDSGLFDETNGSRIIHKNGPVIRMIEITTFQRFQ